MRVFSVRYTDAHAAGGVRVDNWADDDFVIQIDDASLRVMGKKTLGVAAVYAAGIWQTVRLRETDIGEGFMANTE